MNIGSHVCVLKITLVRYYYSTDEGYLNTLENDAMMVIWHV